MKNLTKPLSQFREMVHRYGPLASSKLIFNKIGKKVLPQTKGEIFFSPWNISFQERANLLLNSNKKRVVFFYPAADQGTFRYRVYNFCQVINNHLTTHVASYFFAAEIEEFTNVVDKFDLLIVCRFDWSPAFQKLMDKARDLGIKVIYDTDDLVFDLDYLDLIKDQLELPRLEVHIWKDIIARNYKAASLADEFLCTNNFLAEKLTAKFHKPVSIIPNFLNQEQVEFAQSYQKPQSDKFWVGYFSGTKSHNKDFALIEASLASVLDKHPNINLRLMGHVKISAKLKKYQGRIEQVPFQDFINYLGVIGSCDIVLVPLVVNDFTNCKSELKFFESGIMRVPVIASPTYVHQLVINEGENGLLADEGEWEEKITKLFQNPSLLNEIAQVAHHTALTTYYGQVVTNQVQNLLNKLSTESPE